MKRIVLLLGVFVLVGVFGPEMSYSASADESIVIGRLMGTLRDPPRSFIGNSSLVGGDRGSVEFRGFRLFRKANGEAFVIRPLRDGFFQQVLPPGEYDLVRKRRDRPSYKEDGTIRILPFTVPGGSLINLGTLEIVLQGKPEESLFRASQNPKGKYTYQYRYTRLEGDEAMSAPLEWFRNKEPATAAAHLGKVIGVNIEPTDQTDSSRFILKERVFRWHFFKEP